jgi:hypothetical protein
MTNGAVHMCDGRNTCYGVRAMSADAYVTEAVVRTGATTCVGSRLVAIIANTRTCGRECERVVVNASVWSRTRAKVCEEMGESKGGRREVRESGRV